MSIDFIFFGIVFILLTFGFIRCSDNKVNVFLMLISFFVCIGYFLSKSRTIIISFNVFHLIAFILLIIFSFIYLKGSFIQSIIIAILYFVIVSCDRNYLFAYNSYMLILLSICPALMSLKNIYFGLSNLINNMFLLIGVNCLIEYDEFNYINLEFSVIFKILTIYLLISIIYNCILSLFDVSRRGFLYEKNYNDFTFSFDF